MTATVSKAIAAAGSIGVIVNNMNVAKMAEEWGVTQEAIISERTPYKDMLSAFRPMKPEERAMLVSIVDELYDRFVDIVDQGRRS